MDQSFFSVFLPGKDHDELRESVDRASMRLGCRWCPWPDEPLEGASVLLFVDSDEEEDNSLKEQAKNEAAMRGIPFIRTLPSVVLRPKWLAETLSPYFTPDTFDIGILRQTGTLEPEKVALAEPIPAEPQADEKVKDFQASYSSGENEMRNKRSSNRFTTCFLDVLKYRYAQFSGRASRAEYWYFVLFNALMAFCVGFVDGLFGANSVLVFIYILALLLPGISVGVRRLHDIGRSGWFYLVCLIPYVGAIWLLILFVLPGEYGDNEYGPDPNGDPDVDLDTEQ